MLLFVIFYVVVAFGDKLSRRISFLLFSRFLQFFIFLFVSNLSQNFFLVTVFLTLFLLRRIIAPVIL